MADLKKLAEDISKLSLVDAVELKNILKDEYGIEPAAGGAVMVAPIPPSGILPHVQADFRTGPPYKGGLRIVVFGSSVAAGHGSQAKGESIDNPLRGWARLLGDALHSEYGHEVINVSKGGLSTESGIRRFSEECFFLSQ